MLRRRAQSAGGCTRPQPWLWPPAVAALADLQGQAADHEAFPGFAQLLRGLVVQQEMDGAYLIGVQGAGVLDGAGGSEATFTQAAGGAHKLG